MTSRYHRLKVATPPVTAQSVGPQRQRQGQRQRRQRSTCKRCGRESSGRVGGHGGGGGKLSDIETTDLDWAEDFVNWSVARLEGGQIVGKVVEIIGAPKGVGHALLNIEITNAREYKLIPLVPDIVPTYDRETCVLYLDPPAGLLDLDSEKIEIDDLQWLKQELEALYRENLDVSSESRRTAAEMPTKGDPSSSSSSSSSSLSCSVSAVEGALRPGYLPNSSQFRLLERLDLLKIVERYGGHYEVAACLGLKPFKNPPGYWDADSIELEVRRFLDFLWVDSEDVDEAAAAARGGVGPSRHQIHSLTGEKRIFPAGACSSSTSEASSSLLAMRLLPNSKVLLEHERHDLVYAIKMNGGFRSTAKELGRILYSPKAVHRQLLSRDFDYLARQIEELLSLPECSSQCGGGGGGVESEKKGEEEEEEERQAFPTQRLVRELGRHDIDRGISCHGGYTQVARRMRLQASFKHSRGYWHSVDNVLEEVRKFLEQRSHLDQSQCPKYSVLEKAGRHDLKYGVEIHGRKEITKMLLEQQQ